MPATLSHWTLPQWAAEHWPDGVAGPVPPQPLPPAESVSVGERLWRRVQLRRLEALGLTERFTSITLGAPTVDEWRLGQAESVALTDRLAARVRKRKGKPLPLDAVSFTVLSFAVFPDLTLSPTGDDVP
jgi:hypothetical protein